ncbi:MAG: hypothetical protein IJC26_01645, partial [Clostridia bacterium]|nr:hypothetical protein [Clostridia bacterium]
MAKHVNRIPQDAADPLADTVRRAAAGDNAAFAELAKRFEVAIHHSLSTVFVPEEDRNDLYQEGLIG